MSRDGSAELMAEQRYQPTPFTLDGSVARGKLAASLVDGLLKAPPGRLTYRQWFDAAKPDTNSDDPFLVNGDILDEPLFESVSLRREVLDQARSIEEAPLDELIASLLRVIEQRQKLGDTYPRGRLDLGIAYSVKGDFPNAIELLDRAVALYSDFTIMTQERARDPLADAWFHEARFQLGRVLYKSSRDLGRAVSELELVLKKDPDSPAALYYYGQAIRAMVERETLTEAQKALRRYLEKGAPLGHEDEVRQFLGSREVLR
jgi:tetratricopeptide (TPR) repeat protein